MTSSHKYKIKVEERVALITFTHPHKYKDEWNCALKLYKKNKIDQIYIDVENLFEYQIELLIKILFHNSLLQRKHIIFGPIPLPSCKKMIDLLSLLERPYMKMTPLKFDDYVALKKGK